MPSQLSEAHIRGEKRLRDVVGSQVGLIWKSLPGHNREDVDEWLTRVLPIVMAGRRASVAFTDGYLAQALERPPLGIDPDGLQIRNGSPLDEVYTRPFIELWSKLGAGVAFADASSAALSRAQGMAAFDVQGAMARTAQAVGQEDGQIQRFQRVADGGACEFCLAVDGAVLNSDDVMPLHNHCGCGLEPLTDERSLTPTPEGVAVHDHGELGPVLTDPSHAFTSEAQALG